MRDLARSMWPGAHRALVDADRRARRSRVRSQLHHVRAAVNAGGDGDDDTTIVDAVDHRHDASRHL